MIKNRNNNLPTSRFRLFMVDDRITILAWSFYDWGNSAFSTTAAGVFAPLLFGRLVEGFLSPTDEFFWYSMGASLVSLIVAIMAPFLGAAADRMGGKKKFLFVFACLGIVMIGAMALVQLGMWVAALVIFIFAGIGFSGANIFYDSLLPSVASEKKRDYVSSLGFSLGYIGGGILFLVNLLMYATPSLFGLPVEISSTGAKTGGLLAIQLSMLSVAIWWAIFSIPIALFVKEPPVEDKVPFGKAIGAGLRQIINTLRDIRRFKHVVLFLIAYWFYIDGVDTIIKMAVQYGDKVGVDDTIMALTFLLVQFVAFPMTLIFNKFAKKIGAKNGILIAIGGYSVITIFGFLMTGWQMFIGLGIMVGCFQGGIQALSRSTYSQMIPADKSAEFFGFFNMLGKFSAVVGPFLMGSITLAAVPFAGDQAFRYGILAIIVLFIAGGLILTRVDVETGIRIAKESIGNPVASAENGVEQTEKKII